MSFILDALKKVDTRKKLDSEGAAGEIARSAAARQRRGRELLRIAAIAAASAGVTAAALVYFASRPGPTEDSAPVEQAGVVESDRVELPTPKQMPPPVVRGAPLPEQEGTPGPPPEEETPVAPPAPTESGPTPELEIADDVEESSPPPPVRIVGRREAEEAEDPADVPAVQNETPPAPLEEGELPDLVLQGTSVLAGRPVAVISDQRVFEGDFIEGARVILILERTVELEIDGRRFTLTL